MRAPSSHVVYGHDPSIRPSMVAPCTYHSEHIEQRLRAIKLSPATTIRAIGCQLQNRLNGKRRFPYAAESSRTNRRT